MTCLAAGQPASDAAARLCGAATPEKPARAGVADAAKVVCRAGDAAVSAARRWDHRAEVKEVLGAVEPVVSRWRLACRRRECVEPHPASLHVSLRRAPLCQSRRPATPWLEQDRGQQASGLGLVAALLPTHD